MLGGSVPIMPENPRSATSSSARLLAVSIGLCAQLLGQTAPAKTSLSPSVKGESQLERILNYPFATEADMSGIHDMFSVMLAEFEAGNEAELRAADSDSRLRAIEQYLVEVAAVTAVRKAEGEKWSIVSFAKSNDKALKRLREEIHLRPPKGGAILRVYAGKRWMPPPIRSLFHGGTEGVTTWCRFIAVNAEEKSSQELEDIVSHELTHAFIASSLGLKNDKLPRWFHEGLALYISNAKDQYVSQSELGGPRIATSPADYAEFRLVFQYLDDTLGRKRVADFIQDVVEQQSVDEPLLTAIGTSSYASLRERTSRWRSKKNMTNGLRAFAGIVVVVVCLRLWLRRRGARRRQESQTARTRAQIDAAIAVGHLQEDLYRTGGAVTPDILEDIEKVALALIEEARSLAETAPEEAKRKLDAATRLAPTPRITAAAERAWLEINGLYV
jgi:hypothetical protein